MHTTDNYGKHHRNCDVSLPNATQEVPPWTGPMDPLTVAPRWAFARSARRPMRLMPGLIIRRGCGLPVVVISCLVVRRCTNLPKGRYARAVPGGVQHRDRGLRSDRGE